MALDRQKILNELGSVVNQLQSADCGCMGKLFSNPNEASRSAQHIHGPHGGGMQSCCHHGHQGLNTPSAGEPCCGGRHCMGACNAPKLYADTYDYLNQNMMQPVVREVYDDLKSISPANAVMNNPIATKMGLCQGNNSNQGNTMTQNGNQGNMIAQYEMLGRPAGNERSMMSNAHHTHTPHLHFGNPDTNTMQLNSLNNAQEGMAQMIQEYKMYQGPGQNDYTMDQMNQGMDQNDFNMGQMGQIEQNMGQMRQETGGGRMVGGMGPEIVNMMKPSVRQGQNAPPMNAKGDNIPQTQMGQMPNGDVHQGHFQQDHNMQNNADSTAMSKTQWDPYIQNTQYNMSQPQTLPGGAMNAQNNGMPANMNQMNFEQQRMRNLDVDNINNPQSQTRNLDAVTPGTNYPFQQMGNINTGQMNYGKHNAGMAKFNEMFPGVINGDLGFDPMAIAMQMNPANQQRSAIETMEKMMMGKPRAGLNHVMDSTGKASTLMQPTMDTKNAAPVGQAQLNQPLMNQQNAVPIHQQMQQSIQQQQPQEVIIEGISKKQPQQVYTALTTPVINKQQVLQQPTQQEQQYQLLQNQQMPSDQTQQPRHEMLDLTTGRILTDAHSANYGTTQARENHDTDQRAQNQKQLYREPILPADNSRNLLQSHHFAKPQRLYDYNTIGQPVDLQPAKHYRTPEPRLPQTLSPQPNRNTFSNVKNTISKTSIVGNQPIRGTPSRNQLHNIYNQYKGSKSFTQQNIKPIQQNISHSTGHIKVPGIVTPIRPVERTGGDTVANTVVDNEYVPTKLEPIKDQIGDAPEAEKLPLDNTKPTAKNANLRNGLQDQVFTTYPGSAKWSFHGHGHASHAPFSVGYRFRQK